MLSDSVQKIYYNCLTRFFTFFLYKKWGCWKRNQNIGFSFSEKVLKLQKLEFRITNLRPNIQFPMKRDIKYIYFSSNNGYPGSIFN